MSYPGNASLSRDVKERIVGSFDQALDLVGAGNEREAQLGCEFILGMDPLFHPASSLLERLRKEDRPVVVDDLRGSTADEETSIEDDEPLDFEGASLESGALGSLGDLDLDTLDSIDDLENAGVDVGPVVPPPPAAVGTGATGGLAAVLQDLLAKRDFDRIIQIAERQQASIDADPSLRALVQQAQAQAESARYVDSFLASAQEARAEGNKLEADKLLAKARMLDPEHPGIRALDDPSSPDLTEAAAPAAVDVPTAEVPAAELPALDVPSAELPDEQIALTDPAPGDGIPVAENMTGGGDLGDGGRIEALLAEGQEAFDADDYQTAIDVWSRIFLIDIDDAEASRRIEEARTRKAELERRAEEVFHEGFAFLETEKLDQARASFARVLELQPSHSVAREYLDQLDAGEVPVAEPAAESVETVVEPGDLESAPSLQAAVERDRVVVIKKTDRRLVLLGAVVLVVLVGLIAFLFVGWQDLFPNAEDGAVHAPQPLAQINRATALHDQGKTDIAINLLEKIPTGNPQYDQAQALLAQWRARIEEPAPPPEPTGPTAAQLARRAALLEAARTAIDTGRNIESRRYLQRAARISPLDAQEELLERRIQLAIEPIRGDLELFESGAWEKALPSLWRRFDREPEDADTRLMIIESYYNLAVRALQRGDATDGAIKLREALALDADNEALKRLLLFAESYIDRPHDLLYRIFVKYLPSSP